MPVHLVQRPRRLAEVVEVAQLVRHARQLPGHRVAQRVLSIGDHSRHRDLCRQRMTNRSDQLREVRFARRQQAPRTEHLAAEALADHPQHLVPDVRLQTVDRQDHPPLMTHELVQPPVIRQRQRHQLVVAVQQVGDAALADHHPPG